MSAFETLGVLPEIIMATEEMGWQLPSDVQDEAIPLILGGGDVMIAAETGSGKTGAFAIPILQILYEAINGQADITAPAEKKTPKTPRTETKSSPATPEAAAAAIVTTPKLNVAMNPADREPLLAISDDGLTIQTRHDKNWGGGRANVGVSSGKYYYEGTVSDEGLCRIGWATSEAAYDLGTDKFGFGFGGTGKKAWKKQFDSYGEEYKLNDTVGCLLDMERRTISWTLNGRDLGIAFTYPPEMKGSFFFPAVTMKNAELKLNFGITPFKHAPKDATFKAVSLAPRSETSLAVAKTRVKAESNDLLCIIVEPTRELATQVSDEIKKFKVHLTTPSISHELFIGGVETGDMMRSLRTGVNIAIGTTGRLMDVIKSGKMDLSKVRAFVLDEADSLVEQGNKKDLMTIWSKLPKDKGMQVVICSATLHSPEITELADAITQHPTWVDLKGKDSIPETVDHAVIIADAATDGTWKKVAASLPHDGIHTGLNPNGTTPECLSFGGKTLKLQIFAQLIDEYKMDQCMVFCRTQLDCDNLEQFLITRGGGSKWSGKAESGKENPYSCVVLHAGRLQHERTSNLQAFRDGDVRFLISSDVGARGIDISQLPYVINMTLPDKPEQYIHRIGRVGRAGNPGLAFSIVTSHTERQWYHTCNRPDRGRGCRDTRLKDAGGCTIWFDEMDMLAQIEKRLDGLSIPRLDRKNLAAGRAQVSAASANHRSAETRATAESQRKVAEVLPAWVELTALEVQAQRMFHTLKHQNQWAAMLK